MCAGVGSGGRSRKVPKGWFPKVSEGSGGFWRVPARVGVGSGGRVRKVPEGSDEFRRVLGEFRRQGSEGSGEFRCGLLPCNLDRSSRVIVLITGITLSTWAKLMRKRRPCSQRWHKHTDVYATAVGDTAKAYFLNLFLGLYYMIIYSKNDSYFQLVWKQHPAMLFWVLHHFCSFFTIW